MIESRLCFCVLGVKAYFFSIFQGINLRKIQYIQWRPLPFAVERSSVFLFFVAIDAKGERNPCRISVAVFRNIFSTKYRKNIFHIKSEHSDMSFYLQFCQSNLPAFRKNFWISHPLSNSESRNYTSNRGRFIFEEVFISRNLSNTPQQNRCILQFF